LEAIGQTFHTGCFSDSNHFSRKIKWLIKYALIFVNCDHHRLIVFTFVLNYWKPMLHVTFGFQRVSIDLMGQYLYITSMVSSNVSVKSLNRVEKSWQLI